MKVNIRPCHDRKGIELVVDSEYMVLSLHEAREVKRKCAQALRCAELNEPPAPAPIDWSKHYAPSDKGVSEEWAHTSPCIEDIDCTFGIGGWDLSFEQAEELFEWLGAAIKYHKDNNSGVHE